MSRKAERQPICPKCGYDQSGEIATWESHCPLHGTCSECGLQFTWDMVLRPQLYDITWYTEHARGLRQFLYRTPRTILRMFRPRRFWNQLSVTKRTAIPALLLWCCITIIIIHTISAIPTGLAYWDRFNYQSYTLDEYFYAYGYHGYAQILVNGFGYPYLWAEPVPYQDFIFSLKMHLGSDQYGMTIYRQVVKPIGFQVGFMLIWSIVLLAIPHTRRMAKIRRAHIARVAILSLFFAAFSFEVHRLLLALRFQNDPIGFLADMFQPLFSLFAALWQVWFWATAIVIGWKVRPYWPLILLGTTAATLGGIVLTMYAFLMAST